MGNVRLLQCPEREKLPKLKENVKLIKMTDEINGIIQELLEENESDITDVSNFVNAAASIIKGKMNQSNKVG